MNPNEQVIGRCSICGGDVVCHQGAWWGTIPPVPHCVSCGAVQDNRGPVIPMRPAGTRTRVWITDGVDSRQLPYSL